MTRTSVLRAVAATAALVLGMALQPTASAFADPPPWAPAYGWRGGHDDDGEDGGYPYYGGYGRYPYPPPMIYAPPPVVYPPPAVYAPPVVIPPSFNIVLPLNFR